MTAAAADEASLIAPICDALRSQLHVLATHPDDYAAEVTVNGARRAMLCLREAMIKEAHGAGADKENPPFVAAGESAQMGAVKVNSGSFGRLQ
ncbi:hypothetical protein [Lysobacter sp. FW306-1B-D06B]|uniref:hypothetical protein n=1 Tax=Lysobacter sp. FW306-1B-D06B TaxID=3140250 RepID=UPI00314074D4